MTTDGVCRVCGLDSSELGRLGHWWAVDPDHLGPICSGCRDLILAHPSRHQPAPSAPVPMGMPADPCPDLTLLELPVLRLPYSLRKRARGLTTRITLVEVLERDAAGEPARVRIVA